MKTTILILAHNVQNTIARAIRSARNQNADILIIDDGSIDNTLQIAHQETKNLDNCTIVHYSKNKGVIPVLNLQLDHTDGLICRLDADDALMPGAIDALKSIYKPGTIVYGAYYEEWNGIQKLIVPNDLYQCVACGVLINVEDIRNAGGYAMDDIGIFVEYDLYSRLLQNGLKPQYTNKAVYTYYRNSGSTTTNTDAVEKSMGLLTQKWGRAIADRIRSYDY